MFHISYSVIKTEKIERIRNTRYNILIFMNAKVGIKIITVAIVLTAILGYAYSRADSFIEGTRITITTPRDGATVFRTPVFLKGKIERASHITLNGARVYTDELGTLSEEILLKKGYNIIEVRALDRFGREVKKVLEIVYK